MGGGLLHLYPNSYLSLYLVPLISTVHFAGPAQSSAKRSGVSRGRCEVARAGDGGEGGVTSPVSSPGILWDLLGIFWQNQTYVILESAWSKGREQIWKCGCVLWVVFLERLQLQMDFTQVSKILTSGFSNSWSKRFSPSCEIKKKKKLKRRFWT